AVIDLRVRHPPGRRHDANAVADHLVDVAVAGDAHDRDLGLAGPADQRADHVVRLPALDLDVVEAEGLGQWSQVRPLLLQQIGARRPPGFVLRVLDLATGHTGVPGDDHGL